MVQAFRKAYNQHGKDWGKVGESLIKEPEDCEEFLKKNQIPLKLKQEV